MKKFDTNAIINEVTDEGQIIDFLFVSRGSIDQESELYNKIDRLLGKFSQKIHRTLGIYKNKELMGIVIYTPTSENFEVELVFVAKKHQNKGYGLRLIKTVGSKANLVDSKLTVDLTENLKLGEVFRKLGYINNKNVYTKHPEQF